MEKKFFPKSKEKVKSSLKVLILGGGVYIHVSDNRITFHKAINQNTITDNLICFSNLMTYFCIAMNH
jgi:hypothetical protein